MNIISSLIGLIGLLLICGVAALGLLVVLLITTARLPADNPLRRILHALSVRLTAMLGIGAVAIPLQPIVGLDLAYDIAAPVVLIYLSITLFREIAAILRDARRSGVSSLRAQHRTPDHPDRASLTGGNAPPRLHH